MRDVEALMVRQSRAFRPDVLPFAGLQSALGMEVFQKHFGFRDALPDPNTGDLWFGSGLLVTAEGPPIVISHVSIGPSRVVIEVGGESGAADIVFEAVSEALGELEPQRRISTIEPLLLTQETQCSVTLDFSWKDLVSEGLSNFVERLGEGAGGEPRSRLAGMNLRFTLRYELPEESLAGFGLSPLDRYFIIEPRQNTPLSEQRYFTFSPFGSARHLEIVAALESAVSSRLKERHV